MLGYVALWIVVSVMLSTAGMHWWITRSKRVRQTAIDALLRDKGEMRRPGEPAREALKRARRKERASERPQALPPLPSFARSLERPKSRASWTNEARATQHVGGRTPGSDPAPPSDPWRKP